jgi:hypothetical protein
MNAFAEPLRGPDTEAIPHQQHTDQKVGIDRRTPIIAVKQGQILADTGQVDKPINGP